MSSAPGPAAEDFTLVVIDNIGSDSQAVRNNPTKKRVNGADSLRNVGWREGQLRVWWQSMGESANTSGLLGDHMNDEQWLVNYDHPAFHKIKQGLATIFLYIHDHYSKPATMADWTLRWIGRFDKIMAATNYKIGHRIVVGQPEGGWIQDVGSEVQDHEARVARKKHFREMRKNLDFHTMSDNSGRARHDTVPNIPIAKGLPASTPVRSTPAAITSATSTLVFNTIADDTLDANTPAFDTPAPGEVYKLHVITRFPDNLRPNTLCSICFEPVIHLKHYNDFRATFPNDLVVTEKCHHFFHDGCLTTWLQGSRATYPGAIAVRTCPVCRGEVLSLWRG